MSKKPYIVDGTFSAVVYAEIRVDDRTIESIRQDGYPLKDSGISYKDVLYPDRKKLLILEGRKGQSW